MAKEARSSIPEVEREAKVVNLASKLFAGDNPRVVDAPMIMQQLELDGVSDRDTRRGMATEVTGRIRNGKLNGIFGPGSIVSLEMTVIIVVSSDADGEPMQKQVEVYHRSDASKDKAGLVKTYQADRQHYQQAIEARRVDHPQKSKEPKKKKQKASKEAEVSAEQVKPQVYLVVLGYQPGERPDVFQQRIDRLVGSLEDRQQQEGNASSVRQERFADPTETLQDKTRLLLLEDILHILHQGISREELQSLFPVLRQRIAAHAELLEEEMQDAALQANEFALGQLDHLEQTVFVAIPAKRVATPALVRNILTVSQDDRVKVDFHFGDQDYYYSHPSYAYHVLELCHQKLNVPDEVLLRTIWQEVIGVVYPTPHVLRGENVEAGLVFLRLVSDQFGVEEIYNLLSGNVADVAAHELAVGQLQGKLASVEAAIGRLNKKDKNYRQARTVLDREMGVTQKSLTQLQGQKSIQERIEREVEERLLYSAPNKKDYIEGEQSLGYKRAFQRYERYKGRIPGLVAPKAEDYTNGESSDGYGNDVALCQSLYAITANNWQALSRDAVTRAVARIGNEGSIFQESIFV